MRILGIDLALNHSGFVFLNEKGDMDRWLFTTAKPKIAASHKNGYHMPHEKAPHIDREQNNANRLFWWSKFLPRMVDTYKPTHVGIEDYAISAKGQSMYQIGEVGGAARLAVLTAAHKPELRLHDPLTVKLFAAHHGGAHPETVMMEVLARWPETKVWDALALEPKIDLAVAYVLAKMTWTEAQLRSGKLVLASLHEKEIAVFNRCTKANPTNLLSRDWITLNR